ncbi:MAG: cytochrome c oxidase subunit 3 [Ilumatobacteraceae bacterium]
MYALPPGPAAAPRRQTLVGAAFATVTIVMLMGGMMAVWLLKRTEVLDAGESWLPSGVVIPEVASNIMLMAFVGVCVFAQWAVWSAKHDDRGHAVFALGATVVVALLIINAQAYIYSQMDLGIGDGFYPAMFYGITGVFMLLMIVGILFSAVAAFRCSGGREDYELLAAHAMYWYTMSAVYTAIWFVVYVTK